jgi:class 3 adenylate cyclase
MARDEHKKESKKKQNAKGRINKRQPKRQSIDLSNNTAFQNILKDLIKKRFQQQATIPPSIFPPTPSIPVPPPIPPKPPTDIPSWTSVPTSSWIPRTHEWSVSYREQELMTKINKLNQTQISLMNEVAEQSKALAKKEIKIDQLQGTVNKLLETQEKIYKERRLQHLLFRVNEAARKRLQEDEEFEKEFEGKTDHQTVILSIDIRRSTELMLKARHPKYYASFIVGLCEKLREIILENYGIFDKFTGDGILSIFPDFYSGDDAVYWAIRAADECHDCFSEYYKENRMCFNTILKDTGLGIGIDFGPAYLDNVPDGLTAIGEPVVYACRFSGGESGKTLLNQRAFEEAYQHYGEYIKFEETALRIKYEEHVIAYSAALGNKTYEPKLPKWLKPDISPGS